MNTILALGLVAASAPSLADEGQAATSTAKDQKSVCVTVYNNNLALVREIRGLDIPAGEAALRFEDVAEQIRPETVFIRSLKGPGDVVVLEQNYEYDLLTPQRLMERFVGNAVKLVKTNPATGAEKTSDATLLSVHGGGVYRVKDEITFGDLGRVVLPRLPENFVSHPTLVWLLGAKQAGARDLEATYLTQGLSWKADYVLVLSEAEDASDLTGWVTLNNTSGARFANARLQLVAGDVNIVQRYAPADYDAKYRAMPVSMAGARQFSEETFFEYHLYTLERPTTIENNQQKQVQLLAAETIPVRKIYRYSGQRDWFRARYATPFSDPKVEVSIEMENSRKNGLGLPLPKGILRVYKADQKGDQQFVGEDDIDHTPVDEKVEVNVGAAFDIAAERRQVKYESIGGKVHETTWEIKLRNHKKEAVEVEVLEPVWGDWEVTESSHKAERKDANTIRFRVPCKPDREAILTYEVRVKQ